MTIAPLTPEQQRQLAARMSGMNFPGVRQAYMDDPRTRLGQTALEAGTSSEGVADGGWGILEGLSRMGQGYLGGKVSRDQFKDYSAESDRASRAFMDAYGGGGAAPPPMDVSQGVPDQAALAQAGSQPLVGLAQNLSGTQAPTASTPVAAGAPLARPTQPPASGPGVLSLQVPQPSRQRASAVPLATAAPVGGRVLQPGDSARAPGRGLDSRVVNFFVNKGYSPAQARGIAAGIYAESANNPRAFNRAGGGNGALGLGQHRGPRQAALIRRFGPNPTFEQQLEFIHSELQGGDKGGASVLAAQDEKGTLSAYVRSFMRPGEAGARGDMRRGLRALGLGIDSDPGGAGGTGGGGFPGTPSLTDTSYNPVPVNELPPEPERPVEPTIDPIRISPRKQLAERLMAGATAPGDANRMFPLVQQYLDAGMGEEADLNKQREENVAQLRSLGYQTDMQTYGSMRGNRYQQQLKERDAQIEANLKGAEGDVQHARNLELYGIKDNTARDIAEAKLGGKPYDPNDPRIIKNIREISAAGTAANSTADDATQGLILSRRLNPGGWNAVKGVTAARQAYSADITALEAIRKRLVMGLLGNKLGGGISNSDVSFLEKSTPIGNDTPRQQIQKELSRILNIANRSKQYTTGALAAFRDGTFPTFAAGWSKYESEAPLTNQWGPIPFDQLPSYDQWLAAQQGQ